MKWHCHVCDHSFDPPPLTHLSSYGYFFTACPKCGTKVEEPRTRWYQQIRVNTKYLMWSSLALAVLIEPSMIFMPRWVTILLFTILIASIIALIVRGLRR